MKRLTEKQALRAIAWLETALNMEDWGDIQIWIDKEAPPWAACVAASSMGACKVSSSGKKAFIWVDPLPDPSVFSGEEDAMLTLFHEYLHIFVSDGGWEDGIDLGRRAQEVSVDRLALVLLAAYRAKVKV